MEAGEQSPLALSLLLVKYHGASNRTQGADVVGLDRAEDLTSDTIETFTLIGDLGRGLEAPSSCSDQSVLLIIF